MGRVGASVLLLLVAIVLFVLAGLGDAAGGLNGDALFGFGLAAFAAAHLVP